MNNYWEDRYKSGKNSGDGSYGEYANHKADVINKYILKYGIRTISDFGCGDGNQISLLRGFESYSGFDISPYVISMCMNKFRNDNKMTFYTNMTGLPEADLCLSLDVLYHIIELKEFENYLHSLFLKSKRFVLIFSSNYDGNYVVADYILHRKFTDWIDKNYREFVLVEELNNFLQISAKFYLYKRKN